MKKSPRIQSSIRWLTFTDPLTRQAAIRGPAVCRKLLAARIAAASCDTWKLRPGNCRQKLYFTCSVAIRCGKQDKTFRSIELDRLTLLLPKMNGRFSLVSMKVTARSSSTSEQQNNYLCSYLLADLNETKIDRLLFECSTNFVLSWRRLVEMPGRKFT